MHSFPLRRPCGTIGRGALVLALAVAVSQRASAQLPDAETFLRDLGFSADQISQVKAGSFVEGTIRASDERELDAMLAFLVPTSPSHLVNQLRQGLLDRVDPNTIAFDRIEGAPSLASFAKLSLQPDAEKRARAYVDAGPGGDLNLSAQELAAFDALGSAPAPSAVEAAVRGALLARLQAYQAKGLAGIAPYARSGGKTRSPADDLRSATTAAKRLQALVPSAFQALLAYPGSKPPGLEEVFEWSHYRAHGVPTIALTHTLSIPEGDAWVVAQRQFYVSGGYNCEQAVSGFLPMQQGTLVVYTNRTSTDQVTGFGGGAKRAIGSKLLASELEKLYGKIQAAEKPGGS
jgi:hypothetical protein